MHTDSLEEAVVDHRAEVILREVTHQGKLLTERPTGRRLTTDQALTDQDTIILDTDHQP